MNSAGFSEKAGIFYGVLSQHHVAGPAEDLVDFLVRRGDKLVSAFCPTPNSGEGVDSHVSISEYSCGTQLSTRMIKARGGYLWHILASAVIFFEMTKRRYVFDFLICGGGLCPLVGIMLRRTSRVQKLIYYSHSSAAFMIEVMGRKTPRSRVTKTIAGILENLYLKNCDLTWNLSEKLSLMHSRIISRTRNLVVPVGVNPKLSRIGTPFKQVTKDPQSNTGLVFVGHLSDTSNVEIAISSIPLLVSHHPRLNLKIVGDGPSRDRCLSLAKQLGMQSSHVHFFGRRNLESSVRIIADSDIGLALYNTPFALITDPMKIKVYLAMGIPVITTAGVPLAEIIDRYGAGLVIGNDSASFIKAVNKILSSASTLQMYKQNALALARDFSFFDSDQIFENAFLETERLMRTGGVAECH